MPLNCFRGVELNYKSKFIFLRLGLGLLPALLIFLLRFFLVSETGIPEEDQNMRYIYLIAVATALIAFFPPPLIAKFCQTFWVFALLTPFILLFLAEFILQANPFSSMQPAPILCNLIIYFLLSCVLIFLFGRTDIPIIILTVLVAGLSIANYYCCLFRNLPLLLWDFASIRAAAAVVSNYSFVIIPSIGVVISLAIFFITAAIKFNFTFSQVHFCYRLGSSVVSLALLVGLFFFILSDRGLTSFGLIFDHYELYRTVCHNGYAASLMVSSRDCFISKPKGYSLERAAELSSQYQSDAALTDALDMPNVIVIMNESLADLTVLCDFDTNAPVFPFLSALQESSSARVAFGNLHTSVSGSGTANTELECLTGQTMCFYPVGCVPYQQFIQKNTPSLASQFSALGYRTVAMHPAKAGSYNRPAVYPRLGFEDILFIEHFSDAELCRLFVSDKSMYESIEEYFETCQEPLFLFGLTIQNHGGYETVFNNFPLDTIVPGLDNTSVSTYLSLMRESDRAFQELIEYFSSVDEKTVILMFGDHQPYNSVSQALLAHCGTTINTKDLVEGEKQYITPYIFWSNYDIDWNCPEDLSANYLSTVLVDAIGLPKTAAQKFLLELLEDYPVITARTLIDSQGNYTKADEYASIPFLNDYAIMQYNLLFDRRSTLEMFWNLELSQ